jgi:hypothetical protein
MCLDATNKNAFDNLIEDGLMMWIVQKRLLSHFKRAKNY